MAPAELILWNKWHPQFQIPNSSPESLKLFFGEAPCWYWCTNLNSESTNHVLLMVVLWRIYVGRFFIFSESKEFKKCKNKDCAVKIGKNRTNQRNLGLRLTNLVSFLEHNLEFRSSNLNANTILFTWEITFFIERDLFLFCS